ncbi:MAG: O-antigen ligase family protein, partial [Acidobacteriota bacterium]
MRSAVLTAFRIVGLGLAFALQLSWLAQPLPPVVKLLPASLFVLSVVRPDHGLLVLAGLGPMANAIGAWFHSPLPGIRLLEQLILALVSGASLRWWRGPDSTRLADPAALVAASAAASCIDVQPALLLQRTPDVHAWEHVRALLWHGDYFVRSGLWDPLFFASLTIEGVTLAVTTERIVRRVPGSALGALRMAVAGHAGVALLNIQALIAAAVRSGETLRSLVRILRDVRVSLFYDLNAAASVFVLVMLSGVGLLRATGRFAWGIALVLPVLGLGLWIAGSRAALLALVVILVGMLVLITWRRRGAVRWIAAAAIAVILAIGGLAKVVYPAARNVPFGPAAATRRIMAQTSLNMWRAAPVFGIGTGRFYEESSRYGGEALRREGIGTANENAHNYFLQVLGTEGAVGLGALLLALAIVLVPAIRAKGDAHVRLRRWLLAGVFAYLLTWMMGHPQLVPEAAFAFWLVFGVLAGLIGPPESARRAPSTTHLRASGESQPARNAWRGVVVL